MNALEIATLKDKILRYLEKNGGVFIDVGIIKKDLNLLIIPSAILGDYFDDLHKDEVIISASTNIGGIIRISNKGIRLLSEGGYSNEIKILEEDRQIARLKTKLEIENLRLTKRLSIIALVISIISIALTIAFKIN